MTDFEEHYYQVIFEMPGYTDSYKTYDRDIAFLKYQEYLDLHEKNEYLYKNVCIDLIVTIRTRTTITQ